VSSKRKFSRQTAKGKSAAPSRPDKSRTELRRELSEQRFAKAGADRLWTGLLGWDAPRLDRIWLIQALNDAAQRGDSARVSADLATRAPSLVGRLEPDEIGKCVELWVASGDEYEPQAPAAKWHYVAALCSRIGLGEPSAEQLQDDWEAWTSLRIAAPVRAALMTALAQSEQAAVALHTMTHSDNVGAIADLLRFSWSALACGDAQSFAKLREWAAARS
jgi:hypothetical protein